VNENGVKAVFFDFGGVLLKYADGIDHAAIEARLGLPEKTLFNCLYRDSRYFELHVGKCTREEWLESVRAAAVRHAGDKAEELMRAWQNCERPLNEQMVGLVARLRAKGYRTGIISNTIPGLEERLRAELPHLVPLFDVRIGSGDLGVAKPDPEIYLHAVRALGLVPAECVFTDDTRRFAEAARELGMHGFHFTGYDQFVRDLRSVGVDC
jgi:epoxide hydrolase-like predicted phosphatase